MRHLQFADLTRRISFGARIAGWFLAAAIVVLSLVPADLRPETDLPHNVEHFGIFCATGLAFAVGYNLRRDLLAALLVAFAAGVEIAQLFAPGRHSRLSDFVVDALALLMGVFVVLFIERPWGHRWGR